MQKKADAVFEGGGVKGIGLVGAVSEIERAGYEFQNLAGTSAGAIVAALLGVGYTAAEIKRELEKLDYRNFKDEGFLDKLGFIGKGLSLGFEYGIYEGEFFEDWFEGLLRAKGKTKFGDVHTEYEEEQYKYKVQVIAADLTDRRLLVLPRDLKHFGFDPDEFGISRAVRMSMSIPIFFEPVVLTDTSGRTHYIVDGGVLSNYPIWLLDDNSPDPSWPTFGFKLVEPGVRELKAANRNPIKNPVSFLKAIAATMMDAHDKYHISRSKGDFSRTIMISTLINLDGVEKAIKTTDFGIDQADSEGLYQNGVKAGSAFLDTWDFEQWVNTYRKQTAP